MFPPPDMSPINKQHPFCGLSACEKIVYSKAVLKAEAAPPVEFSTFIVVSLSTDTTVAAMVGETILVPA